VNQVHKNNLKKKFCDLFKYSNKQAKLSYSSVTSYFVGHCAGIPLKHFCFLHWWGPLDKLKPQPIIGITEYGTFFSATSVFYAMSV